MKTAVVEMEFLEKNPNFFDKVLVNDDFETATQEMCDTFSGWYPSLK